MIHYVGWVQNIVYLENVDWARVWSPSVVIVFVALG